jgi:hypothetical protein
MTKEMFTTLHWGGQDRVTEGVTFFLPMAAGDQLAASVASFTIDHLS